jgi:hypothetical protein
LLLLLSIDLSFLLLMLLPYVDLFVVDRSVCRRSICLLLLLTLLSI